jgi:hypothetical protein
MVDEKKVKAEFSIETTELLANLEPDEIAKLWQSFELVEKISPPLQREYELVKVSQRFRLPLATYRYLFELHSEKPKSLRTRFWFWTGFKGKKLWDWLDLALVPLILASGAFLLDELATTREGRIATERYQQEQLSKYFDLMTGLSGQNLLASILQEEKQSDSQEKKRKEHIRIAQLRTLSTLRTLGKQQKGELVRFLNQTGLISCSNSRDMRSSSCSSLSLQGADLREAYLYAANLANANLKGVDFTSADLSYANLAAANLSGVKFYKVSLKGAGLQNSNLSNAKFCETRMPDGTQNNKDCHRIHEPPNINPGAAD